MELIDKAAVVAEIKKLYKEDYKFLPSDIAESVIDFKDDLLMVLDSLSTVKKEVDLEKEIKDYFDNHNLSIQDGGRIVFSNGDTPNLLCDFRDIAKHFFELGLKAAQKGE